MRTGRHPHACPFGARALQPTSGLWGFILLCIYGHWHCMTGGSKLVRVWPCGMAAEKQSSIKLGCSCKQKRSRPECMFMFSYKGNLFTLFTTHEFTAIVKGKICDTLLFSNCSGLMLIVFSVHAAIRWKHQLSSLHRESFRVWEALQKDYGTALQWSNSTIGWHHTNTHAHAHTVTHHVGSQHWEGKPHKEHGMPAFNVWRSRYGRALWMG